MLQKQNFKCTSLLIMQQSLIANEIHMLFMQLWQVSYLRQGLKYTANCINFFVEIILYLVYTHTQNQKSL